MASEDATAIVEQVPENQIEEKYRKKFIEETEKFKEELQTQNKLAIEKTITEFRKKMEPPTKEDIQKLLDQDYVEFTIKLPYKGSQKGAKTTMRSFTIRELPQAIEKKFYSRVKDKLTPLAEEVANLSINLVEGDAARKIVSILDSFEPLLDVLAYAATLSLNPYDEEEDITEEWVRENLSSTRIMQIVTAQGEANRMRDFFSLVSRKSQ